jgi:uncharacterized protein (TIGR03000 family)
MRAINSGIWLGFLTSIVFLATIEPAPAQPSTGWPSASSGWPSIGTSTLPARSFGKHRFIPVYYGYYGGSYYPPYYYPQPIYIYNNIYLPPSPAAAAAPVPEVRTYRARIQVVLPDPEAQVWLEGQKSDQTGATQLLQTPELEMGRIYGYTVKATFTKAGRQVTEERKVQILPGTALVLVDFTE